MAISAKRMLKYVGTARLWAFGMLPAQEMREQDFEESTRRCQGCSSSSHYIPPSEPDKGCQLLCGLFQWLGLQCWHRADKRMAAMPRRSRRHGCGGQYSAQSWRHGVLQGWRNVHVDPAERVE